MAWNALMRGNLGDPMRELEYLHRQMDRLFAGPHAHTAAEYPPIALWTGADGIRLQAELPGVSAADIELTVVGDTVTLKGERKEAQDVGADAYHRRERVAGKWIRTVQMPFPVESDQVQAQFKNGVLEVDLPRAASDKPRKIAIKS